MTPKEKAKDLVYIYAKSSNNLQQRTDWGYDKQCALIVVDEIIKYHESLFDKGFKDVHIALSSPIKTYNDILNPSLKELHKLREEITKFQQE